MNRMKPLAALLKFGILALVLLFLTVGAQAESVLFFGNSFTQVGNVPLLVSTIADAKGKKITVKGLLVGGKNWKFHLDRPETDEALKSQTWDYVVLQDLSTRAMDKTKDDFFRDGEAFYTRISATSPNAKIVLYETWGYDREKSDPTVMGKMFTEIQANYAKLRDTLAAKDPKREVLVAKVGTAFALSQQKNPTINLLADDKKHPSKYGSYLSSLVIYGTIFKDSPKGAAKEFSAGKVVIEPDIADKLQAIADDVLTKK